MKLQNLLWPVVLVLIVGCDRSASEAQRLAEERAALEREKAQLAQERAAADRATNEQERARLDSEKADLEAERARLSKDRDAQAKADQNARVAAEREARLTAEKKGREEAAARQEAEVREREARLEAERAASDARATQTVDFFYDTLDPHGDWIEIERYGYAFRPQAARDLRWRPYTDGGWIYTDYGWTWRSNEPFGWATYHYGRWTRVPRLGWVWIPGSEWGPAWVSWRRSDQYVGWAPLPPDAWSATGFNAAVDSYFDIGPGLYVFVSLRDFVEPTYLGHVVQPEQNVTIINQTVNVTKVTYKTVNQQNVIVNNGPEIAFIEQRGGRPVKRARVERLGAKSADDTKAAKLDGDVLWFPAPVLAAKPASAKPRTVKEQVKASETDRGWEKSPANAQKTVREQAQREARRAERLERGEPGNDVADSPEPAATRETAKPGAPKPAAVVPPSAATPASMPKQPKPDGVPERIGATPEPAYTPPSRATPVPRRERKALAPSVTPAIPAASTPLPAASPQPAPTPATPVPESTRPGERAPRIKPFRQDR